MAEIGSLLFSLLAFALILLFASGVIVLARRRPALTVILVGLLTAAGIVAVARAASLGYGYTHALRRVAFSSEAAQTWFDAGYTLLTLILPAWLLILIARKPNGSPIFSCGAYWAGVLFGYWMACVITGMFLYSWLTGQSK